MGGIGGGNWYASSPTGNLYPLSFRLRYSSRVNITSAPSGPSAAFDPPSVPCTDARGISARGLCAGGGKPRGLAPITVKAASFFQLNHAQSTPTSSTSPKGANGRLAGIALNLWKNALPVGFLVPNAGVHIQASLMLSKNVSEHARTRLPTFGATST